MLDVSLPTGISWKLTYEEEEGAFKVLDGIVIVKKAVTAKQERATGP